MNTKQETNFIKERNILGKIDALKFYIFQIENYIAMFAEVNDQDHFVNTLQTIYVNSKNLYNELNDIRKEKMKSLFGEPKKCSPEVLRSINLSPGESPDQREEVFSLTNSNFHE
jgi:hypothetical protein